MSFPADISLINVIRSIRDDKNFDRLSFDVTVHPAFNNSESGNDIALLRLKTPSQFTPIQLVTERQALSITPGTSVLSMGLRKRTKNEFLSPSNVDALLHKTNFVTVANHRCIGLADDHKNVRLDCDLNILQWRR